MEYMRIEELKERVLAGGMVNREEALELSRTENKPLLYRLAGEIREKKCGNYFDTCSIVNARSGRCSEDCRWCAQSAVFPTRVVEYDLIAEETCIELACRNAEYGVDKFSFVTSGRALSDRNVDRLCGYARKIKATVGLKLCASMGLLGKEQLQRLKEAGIQRYHCNLETSPAYFSSLCSTHTAEEKIRTICAAREVGMKVCSGGIIGMGESMADRIDLALALRELEITSIPLNVLNPIPGTPLEGTLPLSDEEILTTIAVFRFIHPAAWLRFAGGRLLIRHLEADAIRAGINAAIVGDMLTTSGSAVKEDIRKVTEMGYRIKRQLKQ